MRQSEALPYVDPSRAQEDARPSQGRESEDASIRRRQIGLLDVRVLLSQVLDGDRRPQL
jgi:hypothetical protein